MGKGIIDIVKLIVAGFLIPVVFSATTSFNEQMQQLASDYYQIFWGGFFLYVFVHLFVFEPKGVYQAGQRVFNDIFGLFPRVSAAIILIIPCISTLLLIVLYLLSSVLKVSGHEKYFLFFSAFFLSSHIILTAKDLYEEDKHSLKPSYFFTLSLVSILNFLIIAFLLSLNFERFSFPSFLTRAYQDSFEIYRALPGKFMSILK